MRRSLATALCALCLFSPNLVAAETEGAAWSGTYRGRVLTERFLHNQARLRPTARLSLESSPKAHADRGQIAVIDTSGGVVAAPAFSAIAKFGLEYLEIPPDA